MWQLLQGWIRQAYVYFVFVFHFIPAYSKNLQEQEKESNSMYWRGMTFRFLIRASYPRINSPWQLFIILKHIIDDTEASLVNILDWLRQDSNQANTLFTFIDFPCNLFDLTWDSKPLNELNEDYAKLECLLENVNFLKSLAFVKRSRI